MFEGDPIAYWIGFHIVVAVLIVCDLLVLNRGTATATARRRTNLIFVLLLVALAVSFSVWLGYIRGLQTGLEFASGYLIELSLSIDNLFVFLVMFRSFGLSVTQQRKALLFGILGAIVMRGVFILAGIALLNRFEWIEFVFGILLLIASFRLLREPPPGHAEKSPERTRAKRSERWIEGATKRWSGHPNKILIAAVVAVEIVDVVFALDSIPAVLAVTHEPFVVYTSNIFAILGLRSVYFLLADMLERLRFLHFGLAAILAFVGCKMILARWVHLPIAVSLGVIVVVMTIATAASLLHPVPEAPRQVESK